DPDILDFPLAPRAVEAPAGSGDEAAVEERRVAADPDQPAPRADADQRPEAGLAEEPRQGIAARAGHLVDDHDLRSVDPLRGLHHVLALARSVDHLGRALQIVHDVVGDGAAVVEALVEDDGLLADLGEEVTVEVRESTRE